MEFLGREGLPIDKHFVEEDDQPSMIRIREKQGITGIDSDLPVRRRLSKR
jgi:hypothetical protein